MKRIVLLLFALFFVAGLIYPREIRLLIIGNSFADDAVEHYLHGLAPAEGDTIIIGDMNIYGCSLATHCKNAQRDASAYSYRKIVGGVKRVTPYYKLSDALADDVWTYSPFSRSARLQGLYDTYFPYLSYLSYLIYYVKEHALKLYVALILHATWSYAGDPNHAGFSRYNNDYEAHLLRKP